MEQAAVDRLLGAIDRVANANSFLVEFASPVNTRSDDALSSFLKSGDLKRQLVEQDRARGWMNYTVFDADRGDYVDEARPGDFVVPDVTVSLHRLEYDEMRAKLLGLLASTRSYYDKAYPKEEAEAIVEAFLLSGLGMDRNPSDWCFYQVRPDFLFNKDHVDRRIQGGGIEPLVYFDGGAFDGCILFRTAEKIFMLLTNGAP